MSDHDEEILSDVCDSDSPRSRRCKLRHITPSIEMLHHLRTMRKNKQCRLALVKSRGAKHPWDQRYLEMFIDDLTCRIQEMMDVLGKKKVGRKRAK